jgi:aminodeoxyfutalosine deaminase
MASQPSSFIVTLPKAELHLHLEGAIDPTTLLELRQRHGKPSTLWDIEQLYSYRDFNGFLMAFKAVTEDLQSADDYELITYRLMERLRAQNVLHAEVYVSVGVCLWRKQDFDAFFEGLDRGRQRGERDFGVSLLWIFDAVRSLALSRLEKFLMWPFVTGTGASWPLASAAMSRKGRLSCFAMPMLTLLKTDCT